MESHPRKRLLGHQALNWIARIRKPVCATVAMTVAGATLGLTSISADLGPNAHIMMKSTVGGNTLETLPAQTRSRGTSVRYRMEPLPDRPEPYTDSRMRLWLPDQSMSAMRNGITSWDEYSAFRINDAGQVAGWTNLAFPCDDSVDPDNPSLSGRPTAATWLRQDGAYSDISLLQFDGDAHSSMATGISESGRIVGLRQFEDPDSNVIEHCRRNTETYYQAVYWADGNANGTPFPLHASPPAGYGMIQRSAAFDVIDTFNANGEESAKITGIVEYETCVARSSDRWYCWNPIENTVTQPSAPTGADRDNHMLEFCNQYGDTLAGSGLPIETGTNASCSETCLYSFCPHWQYSCCFTFRGFGAIATCNHSPLLSFAPVTAGDCESPFDNVGNCTNVFDFLDFFSEVNRAADDNKLTGWRLGGDAGNASCGGACCVNGLCGPSNGPNDCHARGGYYLGDDTCCEGSCALLDCDAECPDLSGACCLDGTCLSYSPFMSYESCISMGGSFHFGGTCDAISCDAETGACCINGGENCLITTRQACENAPFYGTYLGDNLGCNASNCTTGSDDDCCWTQAIYRDGPDSDSVLITGDPEFPGDIYNEVLNSRGLGIRHAPTLPGGIETRIVGWQESADPDYDRFDSTQAMLWEGPPASENDVWPATNLDDLLQDGLISLNGLDAYEDRPFPEIHVDQLKLRLREAHDINHNGEIVAILRVQPDEVDYKDIAVVLIPIECESQCLGDLNNNGIVNGQDLTILLGYWGSTTRICEDLNEDGVIDAADMTIMLGAWGRCTRVKRTRNARF